MEQYLIEHDVLARLVDNLLVQKYQNQTPANLKEIREDNVHKLDEFISARVFDGLSDDQLDELNGLFDRQENDPTVFQDFFRNNNISLKQIVDKAIQDFSQDFLGGQHE